MKYILRCDLPQWENFYTRIIIDRIGGIRCMIYYWLKLWKLCVIHFRPPRQKLISIYIYIYIYVCVCDENSKIIDEWDSQHMNGYCCGKDAWHLDILFNKFITPSNGKKNWRFNFDWWKLCWQENFNLERNSKLVI